MKWLVEKFKQQLGFRLQFNNWIWIALGLFSILLRWILGYYPHFIEQYYSRGLFCFIRYLVDYTLALSPIPLLYLFVPILLFILFFKIKRFFQTKNTWQKKLLQSILAILSFIGGGIFFFLLLWGFNYGRLSIEQQLHIDPQPLSLEELKEELDIATELLIQYRTKIPNATDSFITKEWLPIGLEPLLRENLARWLQEQHFPTPGRVRGRTLLPKGIFLRFSSSGLYFPFTGRGAY